MTTPEQDLKIQFIQELIFNPDDNGDAVMAVEFFDASKEDQLSMFDEWVADQAAARVASIEAQKAALEARLAELNS
jgi:hypothetical protein